MKDKLPTFKTHSRIRPDTTALHHAHNVVERKVFVGLFPNGTMVTARLTSRRGINHQLTQLFVVRTQGVVDIEESACQIISCLIHISP